MALEYEVVSKAFPVITTQNRNNICIVLQIDCGFFSLNVFYLIFGDKQDTKEFFLEPEFFLDLEDGLLFLDEVGEFLEAFGDALDPAGELALEQFAEDSRLFVAATSIKSSSSADRIIVGDVHLNIHENCLTNI